MFTGRLFIWGFELFHHFAERNGAFLAVDVEFDKDATDRRFDFRDRAVFERADPDGFDFIAGLRG